MPDPDGAHPDGERRRLEHERREAAREILDEQQAEAARVPPLPMAGLVEVRDLLLHADAHERQRGVIALGALRQSDDWQRADAVTRATDATWLSRQAPRFTDAIRMTLGATGRLGRWFDAEIPTDTEADGSLWRLASDVTVRPVPWLWYQRLARCEVTLLDGDPGAGKSLIAATIAACVTTGHPFPDGRTTEGGAHDAVWIGHAGEDAAEYVTVPRFLAAGGDPDRLQVLDTRRDTDLTAACLSAASEHHPRLAVIDSWAAWNAGTDDNDGPAVRDRFMALQPLRVDGAAVLLIAHDRKSEADNEIHRVAGSVQATAAPRMALRVAHDIVKQTKGNLGGNGPALTFTTESASVMVGSRTIETVRLVWLDAAVNAPPLAPGERLHLVSYDAVIDAIGASGADGLTQNQICNRLDAQGKAKRHAIGSHLTAAIRQGTIVEVTVIRRGQQRRGYIRQHPATSGSTVLPDGLADHPAHPAPFRGVPDAGCMADGEPDDTPAADLPDVLPDARGALPMTAAELRAALRMTAAERCDLLLAGGLAVDGAPLTADDLAALPSLADWLPIMREAVDADARQLAALDDLHDDPDSRRAMERRIRPLVAAGWTPSGMLDRWPRGCAEVALGLRRVGDGGAQVASGGS